MPIFSAGHQGVPTPEPADIRSFARIASWRKAATGAAAALIAVGSPGTAIAQNGVDRIAAAPSAAPALTPAQPVGQAPGQEGSPTATAALPPPPDTGTADPSGLQALHKRLGLKGWNIPFPTYEDSLSQDAGGYRTALAKIGLGFTTYNQGLAAFPTLDRPRKTNGSQAFWGQKPSAGDIQAMFLTFDLGTIGIEGGQLSLSSTPETSTYDPYLPKAATVYRLAYYQSLWNNRVEFTIGLLGNGPTFAGTYVGGQLQNPFGPNASIPTEVGLSASAVSQPTAWIRLHPTKALYNMVGVARSISPGGVLDDLRVNPTSTDFHVSGARALFVDELGYQKEATLGQHSTWARAGIIYNTTRYLVYGSETTDRKTGYYALVDRQITQPYRTTDMAYRGLYAGASAMYTSPRTSIFSQYYEIRMYGKGVIASRPRDTITFVATHQKTSHRLAETYNLTAPETGIMAARYTDSVTGSYTARVFRGTYLTAGLQYLDKPSFTYTAAEGDALNLLIGTFVNF